MQAAYNNESQFDQNEHLDEESDSVLSGGDSSSRWPIGTKVLKQFGAEWFEGAILRYDVEDELYWILYDDGDSEDMDFHEVEKAIADYKSHHPEESKDDTVTSLEPSASVAAASAALSEVTVTLTSAASNITLSTADVLAAMQALTKAADRIACAADRIEVAVQQQHASDNDESSAVQQTLLQQQQMFANHQQLLREQHLMQQQQQQWYMRTMLHQ
jgi:hypothetical protein